jgi:Meiotically Up-regulated Gene 113 (MUG113) protein
MRVDKQHILEEIKRTALANEGVPLGRDRFEHETGIKEFDWFGKYWARWSDAVKEAGFTPNQFQGAYDEQVLFDKFIALIRELGHFPIASDIRLKSYSDKSFPNLSTFETRWGTKIQRAKIIAEYCKQHKGYGDILALCQPILEQGQSSKVKENDLDDTVIGFVYLIKNGRYYKIGRSNSVGRREYELGILLPEKSNTVHTIRTDDPVGIEAYWHKRFETKHKNGEWFELTSADVGAFKRRKFM